jgi:hypothetical protein
VSTDLLSAIDEWRANQPGIPTRPEAIRQLVELGLKRRSRSSPRKLASHNGGAPESR